MPTVDTEAMQEQIDEISRHVASGAHAVLIMDRAGWHTTARLKMPKPSRRSSCPRGRRS